MCNKTVVILGCGNVGSMFLYELCLKYYDVKNETGITPFQNIILFDPGIVKDGEDYKTPFDISNFIGVHKSIAYELKLKFLFPELNIAGYKDIFNMDTNVAFDKNSIIIDCRDTSSQIKSFLKLSCDGNYGKIILNPVDKSGDSSMYGIYKSKFYTSALSKIAVEIIFNLDCYKHVIDEKVFLIDFKDTLKLNI